MKKISNEPHRDNLKTGIWVYLLLLIFEGALRKWTLPALSTPLLVIRDPVALWVLFKAYQKGIYFATNKYVAAMLVFGVIGIVTAMAGGHGDIQIAIFGARIGMIHFPFMFVMGHVFTREDVVKAGKLLLLIAIPSTILIGLQFYSPQSAWVNRTIGGEEGAGFTGANGFFRPSGLFSFGSGNSLFYGVVACFVVYFWLAKSEVNKILLIAGTSALLIAIPISISRTLFGEVLFSVGFAMIIAFRKPKAIKQMVLPALVIFGILLFLSRMDFFKTATDALSTRFELAENSQGSAQSEWASRLFGSIEDAFIAGINNPFFGLGLGLGTNVGAALYLGITANTAGVFLISEGEFGRVLGEQGLLIGLLIVICRLSLTIELLFKGWQEVKWENYLPWLLLSYGLFNLSLTQFGQPTALGFSTVIGGFIMASLKSPATPISEN